MAEGKKNLLTRAGLNKLEKELHDLKVNRRQEIGQRTGRFIGECGVRCGKR